MRRTTWVRWGDLNGFIGLLLDNLAALTLLFGLLSSVTTRTDRFTTSFVLERIIPGTVIGVLLAGLLYTLLAWWLARRTGRTEVTAMPMGLDTPSVLAMSTLVLLPALREAQESQGMDHRTASLFAWHVGALVLVLVGVFKTLLAPLGNVLRRCFPRAALLGSLAAVALVLIAFLPLSRDIAAAPLIGLPVLAVILVTLLARNAAHDKIPGSLFAVVVGLVLYLLSFNIGGQASNSPSWFTAPLLESAVLLGQAPTPAFPADFWSSTWWGPVWTVALAKLLIALPFGLATIVGGLECTESAAADGDEYDTRSVLVVQGLASLGAGLCGGVVQNTPYFGHPAYKKMGARLAYPLAAGLFLGIAGYFGWFIRLWEFFPQVVLFPVIVYIGIQTISHCYQATPARDYPALALATLPVLAFMALIPLNPVVEQLGRRTQELRRLQSAVDPNLVNVPVPHDLRVTTGEAAELFKAQQKENPQRGQEFQVIEGALLIQTLRCLGNGFVLTSLLWAAALTMLLDRRPAAAAVYLLIAAGFSLVGLIHSPLPGGGVAWPQKVLLQVPDPFLPAAVYQTPFHWAGGYALASVALLVAAWFPQKEEETKTTETSPAPPPAEKPAEEQTPIG